MITRNFCEHVIKKGWEPYIDSHWMTFGKKLKFGVYLTFRGHEEHQYRCSLKTAQTLIELSLKNKIKG